MQKTFILTLAIVASAGLTYFDRALPAEAWAAVGVAVGAAVIRRPGDLTADDLARELEQREAESARLVTGS
jgi:hypothetical protein